MRWTYLVGIDFGVVDATAFTVVATRPHDTTVYIVESYGRRGMGPSEAAEEYRRLETSYPFERTVADTGGLGKGFEVEMQRRYNIPVRSAAKQDKYGYLLLMNAAFRDGRIKVVRSRCQQLIEEWITLPWHENGRREADGYRADCSDSCLYVWRECMSYLEEPERRAPPPNSEAWADEEEARAVREHDEALTRERWERPETSDEWWKQ